MPNNIKTNRGPIAGAIASAIGAFFVLLLAMKPATAQSADLQPGEQTYRNHCQACHNGNNPEAPRFSTLRQMNASAIDAALTSGKMAAQGAALSAVERADLVAWLTRGQADYSDWEVANACRGAEAVVRLDEPWVTQWGFNQRNHRHQRNTTINDENINRLSEA